MYGIPRITFGEETSVSITNTYASKKKDEPFYAVQRGRKRGIYKNYKDMLEQVQGYSRPVFRKCYGEEEARRFAFPELYPDLNICTYEYTYGMTTSEKKIASKCM